MDSADKPVHFELCFIIVAAFRVFSLQVFSAFRIRYSTQATVHASGTHSQSKFIAAALIKNDSLLPVHTVRPCEGKRIEPCGRSDRDQASDGKLVSSNWAWLLCSTWLITDGFQFENHPHKRLQSDTRQQKESHWSEVVDKYPHPPITTPRLVYHLLGMKGEEQERTFWCALMQTGGWDCFPVLKKHNSSETKIRRWNPSK